MKNLTPFFSCVPRNGTSENSFPSPSEMERGVLSVSEGRGEAGFTLIETLVATSITAIVLIIIATTLSTYLKTYKNQSLSINEAELKQSILSDILNGLRFSTSVEATSNKISYYKNNSSIIYEFKGGRIKKSINKYANYLSDAGQIKNMSFNKIEHNLINITIDSLSAEGALRNE